MKKIYSGIEKRSSARFKVISPIEIISDEFRFKTQMKDISCSGVFCQADHFIPLKTKIKIVFGLDLFINKERREKKIDCLAEVTRIDPPIEQKDAYYNIGINFSQIPEQEKALILKFVKQRNIAQAKEIRQIYFELKEMIVQLIIFEESHPKAEHFRKVINTAVEELDTVAHILECEINELANLT